MNKNIYICTILEWIDFESIQLKNFNFSIFFICLSFGLFDFLFFGLIFFNFH